VTGVQTCALPISPSISISIIVGLLEVEVGEGNERLMVPELLNGHHTGRMEANDTPAEKPKSEEVKSSTVELRAACLLPLKSLSTKIDSELLNSPPAISLWYSNLWSYCCVSAGSPVAISILIFLVVIFVSNVLANAPCEL